MTHTILLINNYLMSPLTDAIWSVVKFFGSIGQAFINARQMQANYKTAELLQRIEYRHLDVRTVFMAIQSGDISKL